LSIIVVLIFQKKTEIDIDYDHLDDGRPFNNYMVENTAVDKSTNSDEEDAAAKPPKTRSKTAETLVFQKRKKQEKVIKDNLIDIVIYCIFISILYVIAFSVIDKHSFDFQSTLQDIFDLKKDGSFSSVSMQV
jgi:hypothetical protein